METIIQANLTTVRNMAKVIGKRVEMKILINTKEAIHKTKNMDTENLYGELAANTKDIMMMMLKEVMVRCTGLMAVFIEVSGLMAFKLVLVS